MGFNPDEYLASKSKPEAKAEPKESPKAESPGMWDRFMGGVRAVGEFVDKKIDQPSRRAVGLPATGEEFTKKTGISSDRMAAPGLLPSEHPDAGKFVDYNPLATASAEFFGSKPKDQLAGAAYEMTASPLNLLPLTPKGIRARVAGPISRTAEKLAEKATGATGKMAERFKPGTGRLLLDEGVVSFGKSPDGVAKAARTGLKDSGEAIGDVVAGIEANGAPKFSRKEIAQEFAERAEALMLSSNDLDRKKGEALLKLSKEFGDKKLSKKLPLSEVHSEKVGYGTQANFAKKRLQPIAGEEGYKEAEGVLRGMVEDTASRVDKKSGTGFAEELSRQNNKYGTLKAVLPAAESRAKQLAQSPFGGLLDGVMAVTGVVDAGKKTLEGDAEGALTSLALGAGSAMARRVVAPRLASSMAATLNRVGQVIGGNYAVPLKAAVESGAIPMAQVIKLSDSKEGLDTLKMMLKDVAEKPKDSAIERRKNK